MAITLKDVAARAGVSHAAASRSFTPGASVSAKTRAKVEQAAAALGYSPNMLARSLTTRKTQLVGLVSNNFQNPVFLQIFDLFTRALQEQGLRPLLVNLSDETDPERCLQMLRQYSVDGVIVASSHLPQGFARAFQQAGIAVVHAFGRAAAVPDVSVAAIDNVAAGRMAAQALIARGYAEMLRFGEALGARGETLSGLCGLGDLVLTCSSTASRNFSLGKALGEGAVAADLMADRRTVAEGAYTAPVLADLAARRGIAMPIVTAVDAIIRGEDARSIVAGLLARPLKAERDEAGSKGA